MKASSFMNEEGTCGDLLKCIYDLNELDLKVYKVLLKRGPMRTDELAPRVKKDRSTVYRSLQRMMECGICRKETKTIEHGGYYHVYSVVNKEVLREMIERCAEDMHEKMMDAASRIDEL